VKTGMGRVIIAKVPVITHGDHQRAKLACYVAVLGQCGGGCALRSGTQNFHILRGMQPVSASLLPRDSFCALILHFLLGQLLHEGHI